MSDDRRDIRKEDEFFEQQEQMQSYNTSPRGTSPLDIPPHDHYPMRPQEREHSVDQGFQVPIADNEDSAGAATEADAAWQQEAPLDEEMVWSNEEDINAAGFAAEGMDSCQQDTYDDVAATPNFINEDVVGPDFTDETKTAQASFSREDDPSDIAAEDEPATYTYSPAQGDQPAQPIYDRYQGGRSVQAGGQMPSEQPAGYSGNPHAGGVNAPPLSTGNRNNMRSPQMVTEPDYITTDGVQGKGEVKPNPIVVALKSSLVEIGHIFKSLFSADTGKAVKAASKTKNMFVWIILLVAIIFIGALSSLTKLTILPFRGGTRYLYGLLAMLVTCVITIGYYFIIKITSKGKFQIHSFLNIAATTLLPILITQILTVIPGVNILSSGLVILGFVWHTILFRMAMRLEPINKNKGFVWFVLIYVFIQATVHGFLPVRLLIPGLSVSI